MPEPPLDLRKRLFAGMYADGMGHVQCLARSAAGLH